MSAKQSKRIPPSYRVTQEDADRAWQQLGSYFLNHEAWTEQLELANLLTDAEDMHRASGVWPTIGSVLAHRERKAR